MICAKCGKHVSDGSTYLHTEPGEFWHPNCWMSVDWHTGNENPKLNPRPMTCAEKTEEIKSYQRNPSI